MRALAKCADHGFSDVVEHRPHRGTQQAAGKIELQVQLDFRPVFSERRKRPLALQVLEWTVDEVHGNGGSGEHSVFSSESFSHRPAGDFEAGLDFIFAGLPRPRLSAPRKELGVRFHIGDELIHCSRRVGHDGVLVDRPHFFDCRSSFAPVVI